MVNEIMEAMVVRFWRAEKCLLLCESGNQVEKRRCLLCSADSRAAICRVPNIFSRASKGLCIISCLSQTSL